MANIDLISKEVVISAAVKMVKKGVSLEEASKATGLRVNQISTLLQI